MHRLTPKVPGDRSSIQTLKLHILGVVDHDNTLQNTHVFSNMSAAGATCGARAHHELVHKLLLKSNLLEMLDKSLSAKFEA